MFCWLNAIERAVVSGEDVKQPLVVEGSVCEAKTRVDRSVENEKLHAAASWSTDAWREHDLIDAKQRQLHTLRENHPSDTVARIMHLEHHEKHRTLTRHPRKSLGREDREGLREDLSEDGANARVYACRAGLWRRRRADVHKA